MNDQREQTCNCGSIFISGIPISEDSIRGFSSYPIHFLTANQTQIYEIHSQNIVISDNNKVALSSKSSCEFVLTCCDCNVSFSILANPKVCYVCQVNDNFSRKRRRNSQVDIKDSLNLSLHPVLIKYIKISKDDSQLTTKISPSQSVLDPVLNPEFEIGDADYDFMFSRKTQVIVGSYKGPNFQESFGLC